MCVAGRGRGGGGGGGWRWGLALVAPPLDPPLISKTVRMGKVTLGVPFHFRLQTKCRVARMR